MSVTLNRADFLKALRTVSAATPRRMEKPILRNAKFGIAGTSRAESGNALLTATNLEFTVAHEIATDSMDGGTEDLLLPAADMLSVLANDPSRMVRLSSMSNGTLAMTDRGNFRFQTESVNDFPVSGHAETSWQCTLPAVAICAAIKRAVIPSERVERPGWNTDCIVLRQTEESRRLIVAGTDGVLMAIQDLNAINPKGTWPKQDVLIPAAVATQLARIAPADGDVTLSVGDNWGSLAVDGLRADFLLHHGRFLEFPPTEFTEPARFDISIGALRPVVQQIGAMAKLADLRTGEYGITMKVVNGTLEISEPGGSAVELPVPEDTKSASVKLSSDCLLAVLGTLGPAETISVQLQSAVGQYGGFIFHTDDRDYRCLLMGLEPPKGTQ